MFQKLQNIIERTFRRKEAQLRLAVTTDLVTLFADDKEVWQFRWGAVTRVETLQTRPAHQGHDLPGFFRWVAAVDLSGA